MQRSNVQIYQADTMGLLFADTTFDLIYRHRRASSAQVRAQLLESRGFDVLSARHFNLVGGMAWS